MRAETSSVYLLMTDAFVVSRVAAYAEEGEIMDGSLHWPQVRRPTHPQIHPGRRRRWLFFALLILAMIGFGGRTWLSYYVDALWFGSLGYADVFWKTLRLQSMMFTGFVAVTFVILYGTFLALKQSREIDFSDGQTIFIGQQAVNLPVERSLRVVGLAASLVISVITGAIMAAQWPTFALYWYAPHGGVTDPIFGRPLNFYLFTLPAWQLISGWLLGLTVITCVVAIFFILASGGARMLQGPRGGHTQLPWRGLSITFSFLLLVAAAQVYLGRFSLLFEDHTIFGGATYTDAHVMIPGLLVICAALVAGAVIAASNAVTAQRGRRLLAALIPAVICYVLLQVCAWYVTSFIVKPKS